jgi:hypothetical protein
MPSAAVIVDPIRSIAKDVFTEHFGGSIWSRSTPPVEVTATPVVVLRKVVMLQRLSTFLSLVLLKGPVSSQRRPACRRLPQIESLEDRYLLTPNFAPAITFPVGLRPGAVVTADLGNGHQDIIALNQGQLPDRASSVSVLLGNGHGTFQPAITTSVLPGATSLAVGDFNGDGKPDLAIVSGLKNSVEILRGNGDGTFQSNPLIIPVGTQGNFLPSIESVAVGDFAHNGKLDLAVANPGSNMVSVLLGNGDGTFQKRVDLPVGPAPESEVAADLGNGQIDLVVADHGSSQVSVLLGKGDGTFQPAHNIDVNLPVVVAGFDSHPVTLEVGDFNGDGKPDLLISQFAGPDDGPSLVTFLPGNGDGTFGAAITQNLKFHLSGLAVGNFSGTGKLDFAEANPFGAGVLVFQGNGDGTFGPPRIFDTGGANPFDLASGDFNGDGRPDLAVANTLSNTVGLLLNTSGQVAAGTTTTLRTSVPSAVFGQKETLTATVTSPAGTPTGTVTFFDGSTALGSATLNGAGQATLTVSLGVGNHALTASFGGNKAFAASSSAALAETVSRANTVLAFSASSNPVGQGRSVTFTATVTTVAPGSGTPTGTVTFFQGSTALDTVTLDADGKASLTRSFSTLGSDTIKAVYNGASNFAGSSQTITEKVVALRSSNTALVASADPVTAGQPVTFTVTVSATSGTGVPTGTITFLDDTVVLAKVPLSGGKATLTQSFATTGSHRIKAVYSGDSLFTASLQSLNEEVR